MNTSTDNHPPQALPFRRTGLLHFGIGLAAFALLGLASFRVFGSEWMFLAMMTLPAFAWIALKSITYPGWTAPAVVAAAYLGGVFYAAENSAIPLTPFQLIYIPSLALFLLHKLFRGDPDIKLTGIEKWVAAFLAILFFSLIYSDNQLEGLFHIVRFLVLCTLVIYLINTLQTRRELTVLLGVAVVIATVLAAASAITTILNPEIAAMNFLFAGQRFAGRAAIGDSDPNFFATTFFLPIMLTAAAAHSEKLSLQIRSAAVILLVILLAGLVSTYSRSSWVSVILGGVIIVLYYRNFKLAALGIAAFALLLIFSPGLRVALTSVFIRFLDIFSGSSEESAGMRIVLGLAALKMFFDSYGLGVGFESFSSTFDRINETYGMFGVNEPHNIVYQILAETGVAGILIFLGLMGIIIRVAWHTVQKSKIHPNPWYEVIAVSLLCTFLAYFLFHQFIPRFLTNNTMMITIALIFLMAHDGDRLFGQNTPNKQDHRISST